VEMEKQESREFIRVRFNCLLNIQSQKDFKEALPMLNSIKSKPVPIELDKTRHLHYDLNAFAELEEIYGSIDALFKQLEQFKMKAIRALLWAGLIHEDENLTEKDVGRLVSVQNLTEIVGVLTDSIQLALPAAGKEKNAPNPV